MLNICFVFFSDFLIVLVDVHNVFLQNALSDFSFGFFYELWNYVNSFLVF